MPARVVSLAGLLAAILSFVPALVTPVAAQTTTATITGAVSDTSGGVVPGVAVTVTSTATALKRSVVSDAERALRGAGAAARPLRGARRARRVQDDAAARHRARGQSDTLDADQPGGRGCRSRDRGRRCRVGRQHVDLRAQLPRRPGGHRAPAAQWPQLHGPRATAARRARVSASRRRLGRRARPGHERQRAGSAVQRLSARRHAAERLHQRPRGQRGGHLRSAWTPSASSASRPTPTAPSSGATPAARSTC